MERKDIRTADDVYAVVTDFLIKYPLTITWRIRQHSKIVAKHLNEEEEIYYIFAAQRNPNSLNIFSTAIIAFTSKRIMIAQKKVLWGYNLVSITPDMFNDFEVYKGLLFGKLDIDTIKEQIKLSDIDPKGLVEIESELSDYLVKVKPKIGGTVETNY